MSHTSDALMSGLESDGIALIAGGPVPTACPQDEEQVRAVLARAARDELRVVPVGLGTKLAWCRPEVAEGAVDLLLSTRGMSAITDYVPGDGTLTAQAGATLSDLAARVTEGGHRLTPDVPRPAQSTLGGVLGAGQSGFDRHRLGPLRHHVLGTTCLLADGTRARSGGKLVKNVTGFDLHRLYTGARGTLCVLLEASLRLFPEPEVELGLVARFDLPGPALEVARAMHEAHLPLQCLVVHGAAGGSWVLSAALVGRRRQLESKLVQARELAPGAELREGDAAQALRAEVRDLPLRAEHWPQLRVYARASATRAAVEELLHARDALGGELHLITQPGIGCIDVHAPGLADLSIERQVTALQHLRQRGVGLDARVEPLELPADVHAELAAPRSVDAAHRWMSALARRFDPLGRFSSPSFPARP